MSISLVYPSGTRNSRLSLIFTVGIVIICFLTGGLFGYLISPYSNSEKILDLEEQLENIQNQLSIAQERLENLQNRPQEAIIANYNNPSENYQNITDVVNELTSQLFNLQAQLNQLQAKPATQEQNMTEFQVQLASMQSQLSVLQQQINHLKENVNSIQTTPLYIQPNATSGSENAFSLSKLFEQVKESVVVVQGLVRQVDFFGRIYYSSVQGSGFIYSYSGRMLILTNNHVISGAVNITVTMTTGEVCDATLLGANPNNDFAVLSINDPKGNYKSLEIISSSTLKVGEPVIVVGTPYGLAGSMSNGIISALNRTLTTSSQSTITGVIQTTAPLNPGNSGGPLMNYQGQVIGIATAIVQESQGIGFAIPSDNILKDLKQLIPV